MTSYGGIPRQCGRCLSMHNLYAFLAKKWREGGEDHNLEQVKSCREGVGAVNKCFHNVNSVSDILFNLLVHFV